MYAGGQSILVGTPSGITLAPEGGAHQSTMTPSIGIEQPQCVSWEPAFGQDLEWCLLHAMSAVGRSDGTSAYFRLSTRMIPQALSFRNPHATTVNLEDRRRDVIDGGYLLNSAKGTPDATIVAVGVTVVEALEAAENLEAEGLAVDVFVLTSPDLIFRAWQFTKGLPLQEQIADGGITILARVFPRTRVAPMVTVLDGHPHTLSFLGAINNTPITCLGVSNFGRSGEIADLYAYFGIDATTVAGAVWDLLEADQKNQ
jgi:pyruvate dehydrogenase E1 component